MVADLYALKSTPARPRTRARMSLNAAVSCSGGGRSFTETYGWRLSRTSSSASPGTATARSTTPASIAARGMPGNFADIGSCTRVMPSAALMARSPSVPSDAVPESTTPTEWLPRSAASERRKRSIGRCGAPRGSSWRGTSRSRPSRIVRSAVGGIT